MKEHNSEAKHIREQIERIEMKLDTLAREKEAESEGEKSTDATDKRLTQLEHNQAWICRITIEAVIVAIIGMLGRGW
ncbi:hemolysin XhlA family protein [Paenibacillus xerothermodurans]|uniref:Hemolysin XhlA n=1 Tax=Paenibacillus xerothermodurans TaxID=1977292 RepID=A0A2W1NL28_PAEXE|nr:hemolysin XhlA family protein [Paenibacillus xerothermodurans]PZE20115.1 hypothetical protein CBW46_014555 [Paenibacillus xerothermodurans]